MGSYTPDPVSSDRASSDRASSETAPSEAAPPEVQWQETPERGSVFLIRTLLKVTTTLGRGPVRFFLRILALYYTLFSSQARRSVRGFLSKVHPKVTFSMIYGQVLRFATVTLDSLFFASGKTEAFEFNSTGHELITEARATGEGAILLSAHLGSFSAMRVRGQESKVPVYAIVYTKHAGAINTVLEELDPEGGARLLRMGEGLSFMLKVREHLEEGALIALMADRVSKTERSVEVPFMGEQARFPTGPFLLAATLKCPVYLTFGLYREPNRYELHCERFAQKIILPRKDRQAALEQYVRQYAARLEHYARQAPDNWFNFFDFWKT